TIWALCRITAGGWGFGRRCSLRVGRSHIICPYCGQWFSISDGSYNSHISAETSGTSDYITCPLCGNTTRATIAKEKGLEGLANIILLQITKKSLEEEAK
ncbi:hypothetical protein NE634_19565, partial [Lacrimispora saccharolytica]|nr:hypothetical protein [Lacrimispora saccharolytica]